MKINRAYKFRMYPTNEQKVIINKTIGCTRVVYNHFLNVKSKNIKLNKYDLYKMIPSLKEEK